MYLRGGERFTKLFAVAVIINSLAPELLTVDPELFFWRLAVQGLVFEFYRVY